MNAHRTSSDQGQQKSMKPLTKILVMPSGRRLEIRPALNRRPIEGPDALDAVNLKYVLDFWNRIRGDSFAPTVHDYDLLELGPLLPRCALFEFIKGVEVIKVVFEGTTLSDLYGFSHQKVVDDWTVDGLSAVAEILNFTIEMRRAVVSGPSLSTIPHHRYKASEAVFLPLSNDRKTVTHVAAYTEFFEDGMIEVVEPPSQS